LSQTPGRLAYLSMPNSVSQVATLALSRTSLSPREQEHAGGLISSLASAISQLAITREWDAQAAVRAAVRDRNGNVPAPDADSAGVTNRP
jgi:hypothetical protein